MYVGVYWVEQRWQEERRGDVDETLFQHEEGGQLIAIYRIIL